MVQKDPLEDASSSLSYLLLVSALLDAENPLAILAGYVEEYKLKYDKILALANRYYSERVIIKIAGVAEEGALLSC